MAVIPQLLNFAVTNDLSMLTCEVSSWHHVAGCVVVHAVKTCRECVGNILAILRYKNSLPQQGTQHFH